VSVKHRWVILTPFQTRVYEKLRFERVRKSQLNGEDLRDRWHNALKNLDDDVEIDPEDIKMRVTYCHFGLFGSANMNDRIVGYTHLTLKRILCSDGRKFRREYRRSFKKDTYPLSSKGQPQVRLRKSIETCTRCNI
jgi:hypothetical protein